MNENISENKIKLEPNKVKEKYNEHISKNYKIKEGEHNENFGEGKVKKKYNENIGESKIKVEPNKNLGESDKVKEEHKRADQRAVKRGPHRPADWSTMH